MSGRRGGGAWCRPAATPALMAAGMAAACEDPSSAPTPGEGLAAEVEVTPRDVRAESIGEELTFQATVKDGSGQDMDHRPLEWHTDDDAVLEARGDGRFRTVGRGSAEVTATVAPEQGIAGPSGSAQVEVEQVPVEVWVEPEVYTLGALGQQVRLEWVAVDAVGTPLEDSGFTAEWTVEEEDVVGLLGDGTLVARSDGRTGVMAEVEGVSGSATVSVEATFPVRACRIHGDGTDPGGEGQCDERSVTVREEGG